MSTDVKTIPQGTNGHTEAGTQEQRTAPNGVKLPIYMDNHATTPMDPRVFEEMLPYFTEKFGNAASRNHSFGWAGEEAVETARERDRRADRRDRQGNRFHQRRHGKRQPRASKASPRCTREKGNHIITPATEHKAVLDTCKRLEKHGYRVTYMPVQKDGLIDLDELKRAMHDKTILVTIMARQQRDRRGSAGRGNRQALPRAGRDFPLRRDPGASARFRFDVTR